MTIALPTLCVCGCTPDYGYSYIDHAHNDFVEIATDYGLTGLALLGALVASTLWTVLKVMARRRSNLPRGIAFGVAARAAIDDRHANAWCLARRA